MTMAFGQEFFAILVLLGMYIFSREVEGGSGPEKEAKVTQDFLGYLTSPGGIYVTSPRALALWKVAIPVGLKILVWVCNQWGLLGNFKSSDKPSKP